MSESRRTEVRAVPGSRSVEWETDTCSNCRQEIQRNRYVSDSARHVFSKWRHRDGHTHCTFYATPTSPDLP